MTENRPDNAGPNSVVGSSPNGRYPRVTGAFAGTTDEIIQWVACKWGVDEDHVRAQVIAESNWNQGAIGDFTADAATCSPAHPIGNYSPQYNGDREHDGECPESVGLGQVRWLYHQEAFEDLNAWNSSAYNLDYTYAAWRSCFEGELTWLNDVDGRRDYAAGDATGCLGVWFSGRWYTDAAIGYIERVTEHLNSRTWEREWFPPAVADSGTETPTTTSAPTTTTTTTTTAPASTTTTTTTAPTTTTTTTTTTAPASTTTTSVPNETAEQTTWSQASAGSQREATVVISADLAVPECEWGHLPPQRQVEPDRSDQSPAGRTHDTTSGRRSTCSGATCSPAAWTDRAGVRHTATHIVEGSSTPSSDRQPPTPPSVVGRRSSIRSSR